ncbi:hypothetical protein [Azospirillum sp. sgz302134]
MPITTFDAAILKALRPEIDAALADLGRKHGITLRAGNATFDGVIASVKLELAVAGTSKEAEAFKQFHKSYGLALEDLDREFVLDKVMYRLKGLAPGRKNPIVLERLKDGKIYLFTASIVPQLKAAPPSAPES